MNWFQRSPVIYDLWADIRLCWCLADYYERIWRAIDSLKFSTPFVSRGRVVPETIKFYTYQLCTKNG